MALGATPELKGENEFHEWHSLAGHMGMLHPHGIRRGGIEIETTGNLYSSPTPVRNTEALDITLGFFADLVGVTALVLPLIWP